MESSTTLICPFCGCEENREYELLLHLEVYHSENGDAGSPFMTREEVASRKQERTDNENRPSQLSSGVATPSDSDFVECPYKCGEQVPASELQYHNDFHVAEEIAMEEPLTDITNSFSTSISTALRNLDQSLTNQSGAGQADRRRVPSWKAWLDPPTQAEQTRSKAGDVRRLSVSHTDIVHSLVLTDHRRPSSDRMRLRRRCLPGL